MPEPTHSTVRQQAQLTKLTQLARNKPQMTKWLARTLRGRIPDLWLAALNVASETGEPLGQVLTAEIEEHGAPFPVMLRLQLICDLPAFRDSPGLLRLGYLATLRVLEFVRGVATNGAEGPLAQQARLAFNFSIRLGRLGMREDGVEAAMEAVSAYARLHSGDEKRFLPYFADSFTNLGNRLREAGSADKALPSHRTAVEIRRELAETAPGPEADAALAQSLSGLSSTLVSLGKNDEALPLSREIVEIRRRLAEDGSPLPTRQLATALYNLASGLFQLRQYPKASEVLIEALEIFRDFAEFLPVTFEPYLAKSLASLALLDARLDRSGEAYDALQKAIELYKPLAHYHPETFQDMLTTLEPILLDAQTDD